MEREGETPEPRPAPDAGAARPPYEAPRVTKKRSLARATLFTGIGPISGGPGPGLTAEG
jgi:hypothetical protein